MAEKDELKEELTAAMHADFEVDDETSKKHGVFVVLERAGTDMARALELAPNYGVTEEDIKKHIDEYLRLKNAE